MNKCQGRTIINMITIKTSSWATIKQIKHKEHSNRVYRMNNNKSHAIASALIIMHNQFIRHNIIIIIELKYLKNTTLFL